MNIHDQFIFNSTQYLNARGLPSNSFSINGKYVSYVCLLACVHVYVCIYVRVYVCLFLRVYARLHEFCRVFVRINARIISINAKIISINTRIISINTRVISMLTLLLHLITSIY